MDVIVLGASPLCEIGSLKEISRPSDTSDWQSTRWGQLLWGDPGWEGSLRMRRQADKNKRRQPHPHQRREVTNRNVLQGR